MAMQTQIPLNRFMSHSSDCIWSMVAMCGTLIYQKLNISGKTHLSDMLLFTGMQAMIRLCTDTR